MLRAHRIGILMSGAIVLLFGVGVSTQRATLPPPPHQTTVGSILDFLWGAPTTRKPSQNRGAPGMPVPPPAIPLWPTAPTFPVPVVPPNAGTMRPPVIPWGNVGGVYRIDPDIIGGGARIMHDGNGGVFPGVPQPSPSVGIIGGMGWGTIGVTPPGGFGGMMNGGMLPPTGGNDSKNGGFGMNRGNSGTSGANGATIGGTKGMSGG